MTDEPPSGGDFTRRAVLGGLLATGVGGLSASSAGELLDTFAPLSGRAWDAAGRELPETAESPYGPATVHRDEWGVPHVEADEEAAAFFAVGYLQGFDRPFQLELQRRVMRGEVAELVGPEMADDDEFHVRMDFAGAAEATWDRLRSTSDAESSESVVRALEAFADGVTAAFESERLTLEFELLDLEPAPWEPVDTLLMEKQIAWDLTGNFRELRESVARDRLGDEVAETLFPDRMDHDVPILREGDDELGDVGGRRNAENGPDYSIEKSLADWLSRYESPPGVGSNSWVVSGEHTESGRPIVANDPHLALMTPPLWYEQHVETPETSARGVTFPGVPFVVIGANDAGAWGFTNVGADVLDCYTYEIDDDGERYRYDGEWREFESDDREIVVAGGENREITARKTVHGPVLEREGETVGVAWTGLTATLTTEALSRIRRSEGVEDVLDAIDRFDTPTQNLTYADVDGRTLYYVTGRLPIRMIDGEVVDGNRIFDGSGGEGEWAGFTPYGESTWEGFVPFEEKPHAIDPDALATANQRVVDDPEHYIGDAYAAPYRGRRIYSKLDERTERGASTDAEFHRTLQTDVHDDRAARFVPQLVDAVDALAESELETIAFEADVDVESVREATDSLAGWNFEMDRGSNAALTFARWIERYREAVFQPALAEADLDDSYYPNDWVLETLSPDDVVFAGRSREVLMVEALVDALVEIDDEGWETYGDWNTSAPIDHPFGVEAPFLNYEERSMDGSPATVKNYRADSAVGASWRMVVEPGGESWAILPGGNSGDFFSTHYDDQFEKWRDGEFKPMDRDVEGDPAVTFEEETE